MCLSLYISDSGNRNDSKSKSYALYMYVYFHAQQGNVATLGGLLVTTTVQIVDALTNGQFACVLAAKAFPHFALLCVSNA